jgi:nitrate/nitrite transporter NarK
MGTIGGTVSPVLAGYIFDVTNNYQLAFLLCLILCIGAIVLLLFLKPMNESSPVGR